MISSNQVFNYLNKTEVFFKLSEDIKRTFRYYLAKDFSEASKRGLFYKTLFEKFLAIHNSFREPQDIWLLYKSLENIIRQFVSLHLEVGQQDRNIKEDASEIILEQLIKIVGPTFNLVHNSKETHSLESFFARYNLLYDKVCYSLGCQCEFIHQAMIRWNADLPEIELKFNYEGLKLVGIKVLESDPHNGQTRVLCLHCEKSLKIVYKPRSLAGEEHLNEVLKHLNANLHLPLLKIINKKRYGWMYWISSVSRYDPIELASQIGALLAISCTIGLTDLHAENLILSSQGIMVVDAEAIGLKQPDVHSAGSLREPNILNLSLLPTPEGYSNSNWWDISLLGFTGGKQTIPIGIKYYKSGRRPKVIMHTLEPRHARIKKILGSLDEKIIKENILEAFNKVLTLIELLPTMSCENWQELRFIYRPTSVYIRTLLRLSDANCSNNLNPVCEEILPYVVDLRNLIEKKSELLPIEILAQEITSLIFGDVPRLTGDHLRASISTSQEITFWKTPDRFFSNQIINISLPLIKTGASDRFTIATFANLRSTKNDVSSLANYIDRCLAYNKKEKKIYGLTPGKRNGIPKIAELKSDLYAGTSGLYLILSILNAVNKNNFRNLLEQVEVTFVEELERHLIVSETQSISEGLYGLLYVCSYLHKLNIQSEACTYLIESVFKKISTNPIELQNSSTDVVSGIAGCLLISGGLPHRFQSDELNQYQNNLVAEIISRQSKNGAWESLGQKGLCGFSHGVSGIKYALGMHSVKNPHLNHEILSAMAKATSFEENNWSDWNWRDLRKANKTEQITTFSAWCHGAAGIALSEQFLLTANFTNTTERVERAFEPKLLNAASAFRGSICCGLGALFELKRFGQSTKKSNELIRTVLKQGPLATEDDYFPLSLFRSSYGINFLNIIHENFPGSPSILLLQ